MNNLEIYQSEKTNTEYFLYFLKNWTKTIKIKTNFELKFTYLASKDVEFQALSYAKHNYWIYLMVLEKL